MKDAVNKVISLAAAVAMAFSVPSAAFAAETSDVSRIEGVADAEYTVNATVELQPVYIVEIPANVVITSLTSANDFPIKIVSLGNSDTTSQV